MYLHQTSVGATKPVNMGDQVAVAGYRTYQPGRLTYWFRNVALIRTYLNAGRILGNRILVEGNVRDVCTEIAGTWKGELCL